MELKELTKGEIFKHKTGYSKTMKRQMEKHSVSSPEELKPIRKARKKLAKAIKRKKHDSARAGRNAREAKKKK